MFNLLHFTMLTDFTILMFVWRSELIYFNILGNLFQQYTRGLMYGHASRWNCLLNIYEMSYFLHRESKFNDLQVA